MATSIANSQEWAWKQFIEAVKALTDLGVIKWRNDCDDQRADLSLLITEGDGYTSALRVWNTTEEETVRSYDSSGGDIKALSESARRRSAGIQK